MLLFELKIEKFATFKRIFSNSERTIIATDYVNCRYSERLIFTKAGDEISRMLFRTNGSERFSCINHVDSQQHNGSRLVTFVSIVYIGSVSARAHQRT